MDEQRSVKTPDADREHGSGVSSAERRRRAHEILSTQRSKLDRLEHELSQRLQHLAEEISRDLASNQAERSPAAQENVDGAEVAPLRQQLAARQAELHTARAELDETRIKAWRLEQGTRLHETLLAEAHAEQEQRRAALATCQEQLADAQSQLSAARTRQEELRLEAANERERISVEREETNTQRRRIAHKFKAQHAAHLAELERRKAELEALAVAQPQLNARSAVAPTEMSQARQAELDAARAELEQAQINTKRIEHDVHIHKALLAEAHAAQEQRRVELAACQEQLADAQSQLSAARTRQEELRLEAANDRERLSAEREETNTQRRRIAHKFKAQHAAHLAELERRKAELEALAAAQSQLKARLADAQTEMSQARHAELDAARAELEQARIKTKQLEDDARIHEARLAEAHTDREQRRVELAACQEQLADAQSQVSAARTRQEELRLELANECERISTERENTDTQRRRIAHKFKSEHATYLAELEQRKAELQALATARHTQLEAQLATANSVMSRARQQLAEMRQSLDERMEELAQSHEKTSALEAEVGKLRASLQKTQAEAGRAADALSQAETAGGSHHEQLIKLRNDCEDLTRKLAAAEGKLKESSKTERASEKQEDLQRRFEMAVEELREMKTANAQLETKLAKTSAGGSRPGSDNNTGLDWAAQKQRLLASLEADDDDDVEAVAERDSIEGTIRITDQVVAQKDREIADLNRLLEDQSKNVGPAASNAAAMADVLDHDELIRQEREKLRQVQAEWREKIGKAEIDISMERAKIARDRAELEEKMRSYQREQASHAIEDPQADSQGKPVRGRWLARLGLKELGE